MADHLTTLTFYQQLKHDDLSELIELLRSHGYSGVNNYELGLFFGLSSTTLDVITRNNRDDVEGCLRECLKAWLKKADNVEKKGGPTICSLVSALGKLGENGVAEGIQRQLDPACLTLDCYISDESLTELLPQLVVILHSEGIIEKIKLPPNDPEQQTIKKALQKGVASNYQNLLKLTKVLKENGAADIASAIEKKYEENFTKFAKENDDPDIATRTEEDNSTSTGLSKEAAGQSQPSLPSKDFSPMIFEDEIYSDIVIDHPLIVKIIKTRQFQRLKDIKQLGYIYQNVPKANYSRLQHSIGMYYLAGEYVKQLQRQPKPKLNITDSDVLCVQIAALCYNLGHGPFSHTFDMLLDEISATTDFQKPWKNVPEASVKMFEYMENNEDLMASFEEYLDDPKEDIAFIKELIQGVEFEQRKDKRFLYEIVFNKRSGLDVSMIDSTMRDAAVLGKNVAFRWRVFLSKIRVLRCTDGELHICFQKDDLDTYNDLFRTRHTLFRELYYLRKNRIAALMIKRILVKSNEKSIIRNKNRRVTISEATKSMLAYSQLNDGILNVIKLLVDDPEVQELSSCLDCMKVIGQIGHVTPSYEYDRHRIKQDIEESIKTYNIADDLIIDPIKSGYENHGSLTQYYYTSDGRTGQWDRGDWAKPPPDASKAPIRIFLVSGDMNLIHEVQQALNKLITDEQLDGDIYIDQDNDDLMPPLQKLEQH